MSNYTAVPTEELKNWQEAREQEMLNKCIRENRARQEQAHMAGQARIRQIEQQEQQRMADIWKLAKMAFVWVAGCALLIILAKKGAIIDPVMQVGTAALSFTLGLVCGRLAKEGIE